MLAATGPGLELELAQVADVVGVEVRQQHATDGGQRIV